MVLLKTVVDLNLGLFGKREEYVRRHLIAIPTYHPFLSASMEQPNPLYPPPIRHP
jgi:hypothetical protein